MAIKIHDEVEQGSEDWLNLRCGVLTASEMKLIITPSLKVASNDKTRAHEWEITAQRISRHIEPHFVNDDMLRGIEGEVYARDYYENAYGSMRQVGFITNDKWGFTIGYSPDGLLGDTGIWECKSPRAKKHVEIILTGEVPQEYMIQLQTGLLVSEREYADFTSFHGGLPMVTLRVEADPEMQERIVEAAERFEERVAANLDKWRDTMNSGMRLVETERVADVTEVFA